MNLRQLQYICEIVRQDFNISAAAITLNSSQPGISRQIKLLERELGTRIFLRTGNRLTGLTPSARRIIKSAQKVVQEVSYIKAVSRAVESDNSGQLTIATIPTHARYVLPLIVKKVSERYPKLRITLHHASPSEIVKLLYSGNADLGVTTEAPLKAKDIVVLPCHKFKRVVIVPKNHALSKRSRITLKNLAEYPLITYDPLFTGPRQVSKAFERAGLKPKLVLSAGDDADIIKTYVEQNVGIAILLDVTYNPQRDANLQAISVEHLFPAVANCIVLHRQHHVRRCEYDFIELFAAKWNRANVQRMMGM